MAHFSDRRHSPDEETKQDGPLPLLATMLGYESYRYLRQNSPVGGRFS